MRFVPNFIENPLKSVENVWEDLTGQTAAEKIEEGQKAAAAATKSGQEQQLALSLPYLFSGGMGLGAQMALLGLNPPSKSELADRLKAMGISNYAEHAKSLHAQIREGFQQAQDLPPTPQFDPSQLKEFQYQGTVPSLEGLPTVPSLPRLAQISITDVGNVPIFATPDRSQIASLPKYNIEGVPGLREGAPFVAPQFQAPNLQGFSDVAAQAQQIGGMQAPDIIRGQQFQAPTFNRPDLQGFSDVANLAQRAAFLETPDIITGPAFTPEITRPDQFNLQPTTTPEVPEAERFQARENVPRWQGFGPEDLQLDPGYAFRLAEGTKAIERSAAARGMALSGKTLKDLSRFAQGLASQEFAAARGRALEDIRQTQQEQITQFQEDLQAAGFNQEQIRDLTALRLQAEQQRFGQEAAGLGMQLQAQNQAFNQQLAQAGFTQDQINTINQLRMARQAQQVQQMLAGGNLQLQALSQQAGLRLATEDAEFNRALAEAVFNEEQINRINQLNLARHQQQTQQGLAAANTQLQALGQQAVLGLQAQGQEFNQALAAAGFTQEQINQYNQLNLARHQQQTQQGLAAANIQLQALGQQAGLGLQAQGQEFNQALAAAGFTQEQINQYNQLNLARQQQAYNQALGLGQTQFQNQLAVSDRYLDNARYAFESRRLAEAEMFARQRGNVQLANQIAAQRMGMEMQRYQAQQQQALTKYTADTQREQTLYNRALQQNQLANQLYLTQFGQQYAQSQDLLNRLTSLGIMGQQTQAQAGQAAIQSGAQLANIAMQGAQGQAQAQMWGTSNLMGLATLGLLAAGGAFGGGGTVSGSGAAGYGGAKAVPTQPMPGLNMPINF